MTEEEQQKIPNPGSPEAKARGCLCPVLDNACGRGALGRTDTFWISENCPMHGRNAEEDVNLMKKVE